MKQQGFYRGAWGIAPNKHGDDKIYFQRRYTDIATACFCGSDANAGAGGGYASSACSGDVQGNGRMRAGLG
ncbi:hypothetical protein IQ272_28435, partial [Chroococcidiopsidales cyanobacterium LEGE 13417]|nr:hypothetical protein [Chroococcidiopsidales cyanobacterium LEGE 13417]